MLSPVPKTAMATGWKPTLGVGLPFFAGFQITE
jgi:hypothetical protein